MTEKPKRVLLGKSVHWGGSERIYELPDALEIDDLDGHEIIRRRVFFDDVLFATHHRALWINFCVVSIVITTVFALMGLAERFFLYFAAAFLVLSVLVLFLRIDVVTVYGRRSKARMEFRLRRTRARRVFTQLSARIEAYQERLAAQIAAETPQQPADTVPSGPPPPQ